MSKVQDAIRQIEEGLEAFRETADWKAFLHFQSVMHKYSLHNRILIWTQRPSATHVAGFHAWKKLDRRVKKGAKGIAILAPFVIKAKDENEEQAIGFRTVYVFDVADTEGSDEYLPKARPFSADNDEAAQRIYEELLEAIAGKVERSFEVKLEKEEGAQGSFTPRAGIIRVDPALRGGEGVHTLLHEWAHAQDFDMHPEKTPYRQREFVAESASFIVGAHLGFDGQQEREHSFDYILSYEREKGEFKAVAEKVAKVASRCIEELAAVGIGKEGTE